MGRILAKVLDNKRPKFVLFRGIKNDSKRYTTKTVDHINKRYSKVFYIMYKENDQDRGIRLQ